LTVTINGSLKDSLPEQNYQRIIIEEFKKSGLTMLSFESKKMIQDNRSIYINEIEALHDSGSKKRFVKSAIGFIDKDHFIDFSVSTPNKGNNFKASQMVSLHLKFHCLVLMAKRQSLRHINRVIY
jgi:hypothetical protein